MNTTRRQCPKCGHTAVNNAFGDPWVHCSFCDVDTVAAPAPKWSDAAGGGAFKTTDGVVVAVHLVDGRRQRNRFFHGINCPTCGATQGDPCAAEPGAVYVICRARKVAARRRRFTRRQA